MLEQKLYYTLLDVCWIYALFKGGIPERMGTSILALASALTVAALSSPATVYISIESGVFVVDLACFTAFLVLALRANRYWPLWIAGLQLIGTSAHAVKLAYPEVIPKAYAFVTVFWGYPMLLILVLGTFRHQQRLARFGVDRSWSSSWGRSGQTPRDGPTD
jgi:hypothetical protein